MTGFGIFGFWTGLVSVAQAGAGGVGSQPTTAPVLPPYWLERLPGADVIPLARATAHGASTSEHCGVYCLYLATRLEKDTQISLAEVSSAVPRNRGWCSIAELVNAAHALGFDRARAVRLDCEDLRHVRMPAIAYCRGERPGEGHFVLLAQTRGGYLQILDYPRRIVWVRLESLRSPTSRWTGEVVLLKRADPKPNRVRAFLAGVAGAWIVVGGLLVGRAIGRRRRRCGEMAPAPGPATRESLGPIATSPVKQTLTPDRVAPPGPK